MAAKFGWKPETSARALDAMNSPGAELDFDGNALAQGYFASLVSAELLAAEAGLVKFSELPDGQGGMFRGIASVGGARAKLPPADTRDEKMRAVRALYLASHGSVRQAHANTRPGGAHVPDKAVRVEVGFIPAAVYLVAVGVAAIVAGAYYATETEKQRVIVQGENARAVARNTLALKAAELEMRATGHIPRELWGFLEGEANAEAKAKTPLGLPLPLLVAGGAAAVGAVAYFAWPHVARRNPDHPLVVRARVLGAQANRARALGYARGMANTSDRYRTLLEEADSKGLGDDVAAAFHAAAADDETERRATAMLKLWGG